MVPIVKHHIRKVTIKTKKNSKEYFIWCDESIRKGKYFSNFFGGILVESVFLGEVQTKLQQVCRELHFFDEIKWHKVSQCYVGKYMKLMDTFFELIASGKIKIRILFTQNTATTCLKERNVTERLFVLYYRLIQHAFGLPYSNATENSIYLRLYFDMLPDTIERKKLFKETLLQLQQTTAFKLARLKIRKQDINEVDSKKHLLLQLLDVVLGATCFRLNSNHQKNGFDMKCKGNRTTAKEQLCQHIYKKLITIQPGFTIDATTEIKSEEEHWLHYYRHCNFKSCQ